MVFWAPGEFQNWDVVAEGHNRKDRAGDVPGGQAPGQKPASLGQKEKSSPDSQELA